VIAGVVRRVSLGASVMTSDAGENLPGFPAEIGFCQMP